jgi:hypothetical protein
MGLLDNTTHRQYYEGNDYGNYQFTSLDDIITQFQIAYVGENKIIPKIKRTDIAFHAQRALQELSFDTFKSIKAYQIEIPPSLQMILPHDYVNYSKISSVDSAGIKHLLYPTKHTSNPFQIRQNTNGEYDISSGVNSVVNSDFSNALSGTWSNSPGGVSGAWETPTVPWTHPYTAVIYPQTPGNAGGIQDAYDNGLTAAQAPDPKFWTEYINDDVNVISNELVFKHLWVDAGQVSGRSYGVWQKIDVSKIKYIDLIANGESATQQTETITGDLAGFGVVRVGISSVDPSIGWDVVNHFGNTVRVTATHTAPFNKVNPSPNYVANNLDLGYLEWDDGTTSQETIESIDVINYDDIWVYIQSHVPFTSLAETAITNAPGGNLSILPVDSTNNTHSINRVDNISIVSSDEPDVLLNTAFDTNSSTWNNYKSTTPSENNTNDYIDNTYWPNQGERFGLEPSHAQINGSFFIDSQRGKIHFSSNISGKNVILDYISDSLGTDKEMQVHKFAEEAIYKWIAYAILSTSSIQLHQQLASRFKKEKFAETRKAKLRLSNIKLEEITQILRGKSKHIKH